VREPVHFIEESTMVSRHVAIALAGLTMFAAGCSASPGTSDEPTKTQKAAVDAASYTLRIDQITILNTRSWHLDSDVVTIGAIGDGVAAPTTTLDMGDVNNGFFPVYLRSSTVGVTSGATFTFAVTNAGFDRSNTSTARSATDDIAKAVASAGTDGSPVWGYVSGAISKIGGIFTADCDGVVAADKLTFDAETLARLTAYDGTYGETRHYAGTDSPWGCGSNSDYYVTWTVVREGSMQATMAFDGHDARASTALGDWMPNSFKAECAVGEPVQGLATYWGSSTTRSALCRNGTQPRSIYTHARGCHALDFSSQDARGTTATGDWDYGFYKGECGTNEYVAGVAQSGDGKIDGILCCPGVIAHEWCSTVHIDPYSTSEASSAGDWDPGYLKANCGDGRYVAGISHDAPTGTPHALLCCSP
jgi:hypothetical protein